MTMQTAEVDETLIESVDVVEALTQVGKDDETGVIEPAAVVDAARDPESPLHRFFEWDDTEAAERYRIVQARHLIARVRVTVTDKSPSAPHFVNVRVETPSGPRRGYVPMTRAVLEPDLYAQVVADARKGVAAYRDRLAAFEQARSVVSRLDDVLAEMEPAA